MVVAVLLICACSRGDRVGSRIELGKYSPPDVDSASSISVFDKHGHPLVPESQFLEQMLLDENGWRTNGKVNICVVLDESALTATMVPSMLTACVVPGIIGINGGVAIKTEDAETYVSFKLRRTIWLPLLICNLLTDVESDKRLAVARHLKVYYDWKLLEELFALLRNETSNRPGQVPIGEPPPPSSK